MTNIKIIKKVYDKKSEEYYKKLLNSDNSLWINFTEVPMKKILKEVAKNKKVLDLGCGTGIRTSQLSSLNPKKIVGLDLSPKLIKIAKNNFPKIEFYSGDAKRTGFKNSEFDVINSGLMIHYFNSLNPLFKEVSRILKPKGYFVFSMHHPIYEVTKRKEEKKKTKYLLEPYFNNKDYKWELLKGMELVGYHHTFEDIFSSLKKSGFVIEELVEPHKIYSKKKFNKKNIERVTRYPSFLIIKAKKIK